MIKNGVRCVLEVIWLTSETVTGALRKQKYNCLSAERSAAASGVCRGSFVRVYLMLTAQLP